MKKNPRVGLPEVSRLINSAIRNRNGDQRKHSFLEKKKSIKGKMDSLWTPRSITSLDGSCYEAINSSVSQTFFHIWKCLACNAEKNITVEDNKKRMNIANFINIYTNKYTYIICGENDSK